MDFNIFTEHELLLIQRIIMAWDCVPAVVTFTASSDGIELVFEPGNCVFRVTGFFPYTITDQEIRTLLDQMRIAFLSEAESLGIYPEPVLQHTLVRQSIDRIDAEFGGVQ